MIKCLNQKINGLRRKIAEMARNQESGQKVTETNRQDIINLIERCEMQFIRSKKNSRKRERRRQTWHCEANQLEIRQDASETEPDSSRVLMPPPPPIFTTQRGSDSIYCSETFKMPDSDALDEQFEPGENVTFSQTPSPKQIVPRIHTPKMFKRRLSAIIEGVISPSIGTVVNLCDRCKELEMELKELSDFTKLERLYHVHEETDRNNCEDVIHHLQAELDEAKRM